MTRASCGAVLLGLGCAVFAWGGCRRGASVRVPTVAPVPDGEVGYRKGQLHAHSSGSGDSWTPPQDVARWYARHGYDFVVLTDHNVVTTVPSPDGLLVVPGVELTQNLETCEPVPAAGMQCLLHVNALFVPPAKKGAVRLAPTTSRDRHDVFKRALDWAGEQGAVAQLNHPNFDYAMDGSLLGRLAGEGAALVEVANQAWDSNNGGDAEHPSTEALWDQALSKGALIFGTATDDAHHYDDAPASLARGERPFVGDVGFVMVRSRKDPGAIREALRKGDFYASTGLLLRRADIIGEALVVEVMPGQSPSCEISFIGAGGRVLARMDGHRAEMPLSAARPGYLRAVARGSDGRKAWVQPVRVP